MSKLSKKDMEELREFMDRGCEYAGTQEIVDGLMDESLREMGVKTICAEDVQLVDWDESSLGTLEDFCNIFWDKAVEKILNVVKTQ